MILEVSSSMTWRQFYSGLIWPVLLLGSIKANMFSLKCGDFIQTGGETEMPLYESMILRAERWKD